MTSFHLFYANQLHSSYTTQEWYSEARNADMPDGIYLLIHNPEKRSQGWYIHRWGSFSPINLSDVPAEYRLLCLLLDIPT